MIKFNSYATLFHRLLSKSPFSLFLILGINLKESMFSFSHRCNKYKYNTFLFLLCSPQAPPPPEQSWEDKSSSVSHLGYEDFRETLKKKKHALVMFYAPCTSCSFLFYSSLFSNEKRILLTDL